jgi:hypothetical protein
MIRLIVALLLLVASVAEVHAAPVTFEFTGRISEIEDGAGVWGHLMVGAPVSGSYTFDPDAPDQDLDEAVGVYVSPDFSITLRIEGRTFATDQANPYLPIIIRNATKADVDAIHDEYSVNPPTGSPDTPSPHLTSSDPKIAATQLYLHLTDPTRTLLTSDDLPEDPPDLKLWKEKYGELYVILKEKEAPAPPACEAGCEEEPAQEEAATKPTKEKPSRVRFVLDTIRVVVPLIANAGPDPLPVVEGTPVALSGTGSTGPGPLSYFWKQHGGTPVTLDDPKSPTQTFMAPPIDSASEVLTFTLIVSDRINTAEDSVNVTVLNRNTPPVADAGDDQTVDEGVPVTLSAVLSHDVDHDALSYRWEQPEGPTVTLHDPTSPTPTFTAPWLAGGLGGPTTLVFRVHVDDGFETASDDVTVVVEQENHAPVAFAGDNQTVSVGALVTLIGTGTDPDGDALSYSWTQVDGPGVELVDGNTATPTFVAPPVSDPTALTFELTVSDGGLESAPAQVVVHVVNPNDPPQCRHAYAWPFLLWPPTHKMIPITIHGVHDKNHDRVTIQAVSVTQDEPVSGQGAGSTSPDAVITDRGVLLRAERAGNGNGRVYHVTFTATDDQGASCDGMVWVAVPRDFRHWIYDDGQDHDSTQP